jgi:peptide/nickel transport system substrate-binding protein
MSGVFVICRSGLDDHDSVAAAGAGTGPYELTEAVANDHYSFAPRADYTWGPDGQTMTGEGHPGQIQVRIVPNQGTIANLLLSGEVNYASVRGQDAQRVPDSFEAIETPVPAGELWFNENDGRPTADPAVREALVAGVDRDAFAKVATGGTGREVSSLITLAPNPCGATSDLSGSLPEVDQDRARQLLDDAGWVPGADGIRAKDGQPLSLRLVYDALGLSSRSSGIEYLASQWGELGVDVDVQVMPDAQISEVLFSTGEWEVTATPFTFNLPSQLVGFVSGPASPEGANFAAMDNPAYQTAVAEALPLVGEDSCPAWNQAERALVESFNPAPMFEDVERTFYDKAEVTAPGLQIWPTSIRMLDS